MLQEQVQCQCQQGCVLILGAVSGHQQKQQHHDQICGIKVAGQYLAQKTLKAVIAAVLWHLGSGAPLGQPPVLRG